MNGSEAAPVAPAAEAAPPQDVTATPATEATPPEGQTEAPPSKTFTQEELDAAIGKRLAKERRKWERDTAKAAPQQPQPTGDLKADQFSTPEEYAEALAERKAEEKLAQREQERQLAEIMSAHEEREEEARTKYDDFEQVAYNPNLKITEVMAATIRASDVGPDVAYFLGSNPKEAARISGLSPFLQAKEIGRIEAKLVAEPPKKKTSSAPAPIAPVTARGGGDKSHDTTDPRSVASMSTSEWIAAERERQIKKWNAQHR